jgi:hypothetical protein
LKALNDTVEAIGQWKERKVPSKSSEQQKHAKMLLFSFSTHLTAIYQMECYEFNLSNDSKLLTISDGFQKVEVT